MIINAKDQYDIVYLFYDVELATFFSLMNDDFTISKFEGF